MNENSLKELFLSYIAKKGYQCNTEVKILERRIDIVGKKRKKTTAFELKISDWKKAIQQAMTTKLCVDYSYVVFSSDFEHRLDYSDFSERGIGLFLVSDKGEIKKAIEPKRSKLINPSLYRYIINKLDGQNGSKDILQIGIDS